MQDQFVVFMSLNMWNVSDIGTLGLGVLVPLIDYSDKITLGHSTQQR